MTPEERLAAGELAGDGFAGIVATIRDTHAAVARRAFAGAGAASAPVEVAHDAIAGLAYGATGLLGRSLFRLAGHAAGIARARGALDEGVAGRVALGALSGLAGDRLAERRSPLAVRMAVRARGRDVPATPPGLAEAFPTATGRVVVFVHGLCETEDAWRLRAGRSAPYGELLRRRRGFTPVYVRYNTGLHVSDNGRRLAALLGEVAAGWPVPVAQIVLVGHSMGGLLARSACHYGAGSAWLARVSHVVMLGTPHAGAPLERGAHALAWRLSQVPETSPWGRLLAGRSAGIRDMGHGYLTEECWSGQDPAALRRHAARQISFCESVEHCYVSAALIDPPDHRLGRRLGDLLVLHDSAWGRVRRYERLPFPVDRYSHVGRATHFDLLNHPMVAEQLVRWLSGPRELGRSADAGPDERVPG